ncbi:F-box domain-containing protein [Caenorhabditis elegans]|uniref:F-box domain-containing protein n=1 Tax=Caenorhabditis elegans TaxID=6239 RepID=Q19169_CAEEL|nr:F-box domain-containing protein [Caenorhabditis elegans]CCD66894.1 F-box domain-containing protein [Caenorhabditis elegans]|eukprot:NP_508315.2 F-box A protein [Caenorhabditis elegans]
MTNIGLKTPQRNLVLPTFLNMPLNVANLVLEKLEPVDRLSARKVCRSLKTAVEKFGLRFDDIDLILREQSVDIDLNGTAIIYTNAANARRIVCRNGEKKIIDRENFVERALKDFKILSNHARNVVIWNMTEHGCGIVSSLIQFLKPEKCILVMEIELNKFSFDEVLTILPCFEDKELKKIELSCIASIERFEQITHLEQWKNADKLVFWDSKIASTMIIHMFHFKCFRIHDMDEVPAQIAIQMRDNLLRRSTFQSCEIIFAKSKSNPIELAKVFKPDYIGDSELFLIHFSNGNSQFDISLKYWETDSNYFLLKIIKL